MSNSTSPTPFSGDADHFYDPNYTAEISQKMRVPKRINVDGVSDLPNVGKPESHWMPAEKLDMFVPEKIVVAEEQYLDLYNGQDSLYGTRSIPREITLDNTIMPPDPGIIRVQTPPRVITIDSHYYPEEYSQPQITTFKEIKNKKVNASGGNRLELENSNMSLNESSAMNEGMTVNEEVVHLRRQLAKLNRRVMSIELDNMQRQNRDRIVYALGLAYFFFKTVLWLSRS